MAIGDALLALLLPGPRHGYDLKRTHDEWFAGLRPLAFGQVYSTLARLQRDDLIEIAQTEIGDGPERTVYELTEPGRARARDWLAEPIDPGVTGGVPADELIRKTLAAYRLHADPGGLMSRQRATHLRAMRALEPAPGETDHSAAALGRTGVRDLQRLHLDADLRWLDLTGERIRRLPAPEVGMLPGAVLEYPTTDEPDEPDEPDEGEDPEYTDPNQPAEGARS
ncbi:PadR family transcriptional regulator [Kineosporia mesophila]|nr:PadR family transcriptional regulator [Kineosporia mesophila]MCD5351422.1 PadR family transcriptional regulator [Kineosporia mesophila]